MRSGERISRWGPQVMPEALHECPCDSLFLYVSWGGGTQGDSGEHTARMRIPVLCLI
jgi:hypothetical protein